MLEDMEKIPVLEREDISREIATICNEERGNRGGIPLVHHNVETNGIGYVTLLFDLSGVPKRNFRMWEYFRQYLGSLTRHIMNMGNCSMRSTFIPEGSDTSLELYPDVTKVKEKNFGRRLR